MFARKQSLIKLAVKKSSQKGVWLTLDGCGLLIDGFVCLYISPRRKMKIPQPSCSCSPAPVGERPDKTRSPQTTGENLTERPTAEKQPFFGRWRKPHRPSTHRGLRCLQQLSDEVVNPG